MWVSNLPGLVRDMRLVKTYVYFVAILSIAVLIKMYFSNGQITEGLTANAWYFSDWFVVSVIVACIVGPVLYFIYKKFYGIPGKNESSN